MTKIKICGIKTLPNALAAIDAGADYLGFNFYPKSVRFIETDVCAEITSVLKSEYPNIELVGVFVNLSVDEIKQIIEACSLDLAQLHGDETPAMLKALDGKAFKAFRGVPKCINGFVRENAPALLVDAAVKGAYGGTGVRADWSAAAGLAKRYPLLLAGGLTPENVAEAVRQVRPWGVDVASGVEVPPQLGGKAAPGVKDASKMKAFVQAVKAESNDSSR
jgi:phosphoribosylanthranilate isomerase